MSAALAQAGADVVVTSRTKSQAVAAADALAREWNVNTLGVALDVCDEKSLETAQSEIEATLGSPDILVNNAGGTVGASPTHLFERSVGDIREMLDLNLLGTILATRQFAPAMAKNRQGKIINIASVAALVGRDRGVYAESGLRAQPVEYAAAKAGLIGFTTDCAGLLGPDGICVNAISPGGFSRKGTPEEFQKLYSARTALGRMGRESGDDLDGAVVYLASSASDYVTGHNLVVDGGFSFWK